MSLSLAENVIVVGADNRPPMLDKTNYSSWASQFENETTLATVRPRTYTDLTNKEKIRESVDIKATDIVLKGSEISLQERESKLYDAFDTFTSMPGESIHSYYMWVAQLINDMNTIGITMKPLQVNTKFVNHLQPEWSKFVTDVKLAKDMNTTNYDHLYAYLRQHEAHENEVPLQKQRYPDQIALVANSPSCLNPTKYYQQLSSATQQYYSPPTTQHSYDAPIQPYHAPALQQSYQALAFHQPLQPSFLELDSGLVVPSFNPSDDPITSLNKAMAFLSTSFASCFPQTNNQLRTSSNPRNKATIQDGRVTVQLVQGRQTQGYTKSRVQSNATNQGVNRQGAAGQSRVVKCYNCQEEGHLAR
ncbi:transcription factor GTE1-like protein [Tanacetum coccineum]|uniref:Transcription factor GTE1-like protein n=1 Tax=Tanacetum coccineum TaxID=301880 RepID=A0ABQ5EEE9_9ASTR